MDAAAIQKAIDAAAERGGTVRLGAMNDAFAALGLPKYDDTEGKEGK